MKEKTRRKGQEEMQAGRVGLRGRGAMGWGGAGKPLPHGPSLGIPVLRGGSEPWRAQFQSDPFDLPLEREAV